MATYKFAGSTDKSLCLNRHTSYVTTGGVKHRAEMLMDMDDDYFEASPSGTVFSLSGCLDAPEHIPSGHTVRSHGYPDINVWTRPATVCRA